VEISVYAAERKQQILKILREESSASVAQLATRFGVSRATIRRDLNELEKYGVLERTYGGALNSRFKRQEPTFVQRAGCQTEEKMRIGKAAAALLEPGETLFLDGGTTTECIVQHLADKPQLTIVTYGVNIVSRLAGCDNVTVICMGGNLLHRAMTLVGAITDSSLDTFQMRFNKAFIAAIGVSVEGGISNLNVEEVPIKQRAIECSDEVIILADSSKIGVHGLTRVAPISKAHHLITGSGAPQDEIRALRKAGLDVICV
jgi:DeoR/GlpR family transcriptional regulator of sugar metabolism